MEEINEQTTVYDAKLYLRENFSEGLACPCCGQFVKKYKYNLFATSALALIDLLKISKETGDQYHHVKTFAEARNGLPRASHFAQLRFWGLIEPMKNNEFYKKASGMWSITARGVKFVMNDESVRKSVYVFNNKFLGFDGGKITIKEALGNKFNYSEIMSSNY